MTYPCPQCGAPIQAADLREWFTDTPSVKTGDREIGWCDACDAAVVATVTVGDPFTFHLRESMPLNTRALAHDLRDFSNTATQRTAHCMTCPDIPPDTLNNPTTAPDGSVIRWALAATEQPVCRGHVWTIRVQTQAPPCFNSPAAHADYGAALRETAAALIDHMEAPWLR